MSTTSKLADIVETKVQEMKSIFSASSYDIMAIGQHVPKSLMHASIHHRSSGFFVWFLYIIFFTITVTIIIIGNKIPIACQSL